MKFFQVFVGGIGLLAIFNSCKSTSSSGDGSSLEASKMSGKEGYHEIVDDPTNRSLEKRLVANTLYTHITTDGLFIHADNEGNESSISPIHVFAGDVTCNRASTGTYTCTSTYQGSRIASGHVAQEMYSILASNGAKRDKSQVIAYALYCNKIVDRPIFGCSFFDKKQK